MAACSFGSSIREAAAADSAEGPGLENRARKSAPGGDRGGRGADAYLRRPPPAAAAAAAAPRQPLAAGPQARGPVLRSGGQALATSPRSGPGKCSPCCTKRATESSQPGRPGPCLLSLSPGLLVPIPSGDHIGFAGVLAGEGISIVACSSSARWRTAGFLRRLHSGTRRGAATGAQIRADLLITASDIDQRTFLRRQVAWAPRWAGARRGSHVRVDRCRLHQCPRCCSDPKPIGTAVWVTARSTSATARAVPGEHRARHCAGGVAIAAVAIVAIAAFVMYRLRIR